MQVEMENLLENRGKRLDLIVTHKIAWTCEFIRDGTSGGIKVAKVSNSHQKKCLIFKSDLRKRKIIHQWPLRCIICGINSHKHKKLSRRCPRFCIKMGNVIFQAFSNLCKSSYYGKVEYLDQQKSYIHIPAYQWTRESLEEDSTDSKAPSPILTAVLSKLSSPIPKLSSPMPNLFTPMPKLSSPMPKLSSPMPKVFTPMPKLSSPMSKLSSPMPNLFSPMPNLFSPMPNLSSPMPNLFSPMPNLSSPMPKLFTHMPKLSLPMPSLSSPMPKLFTPMPKLSSPMPKLSSPMPKIPQLNPEMRRIYAFKMKLSESVLIYACVRCSAEQGYNPCGSCSCASVGCASVILVHDDKYLVDPSKQIHVDQCRPVHSNIMHKSFFGQATAMAEKGFSFSGSIPCHVQCQSLRLPNSHRIFVFERVYSPNSSIYKCGYCLAQNKVSSAYVIVGNDLTLLSDPDFGHHPRCPGLTMQEAIIKLD